MTGTHVSFVSNGVPSETTSICHVGIFGTRFTRETDFQTSIEIEAGDLHSIQIEKVRAVYPLTHDLEIHLRQKQGDEHSFVTIEESSSFSKVLIDTEGVSPGEYTLMLESFNALANNDGAAPATLKTDTITVSIKERPALASLESDPSPVEIHSGTKSSWELPRIKTGNLPLLSV